METSGIVFREHGLETSALSLDIPGLFKTFSLDAQATLEPVSSVSGELIDGELVLSLQARIRLADIRLKLFGVPIATTVSNVSAHRQCRYQQYAFRAAF